MPALVVCSPPSFDERRVFYCPICKQRRRMLCRRFVWYGTELTCLGCGDSWTDGELHPRPFKPGWREESKQRARRLFAACAPRQKGALRRWINEQLGER